MASRDDYKQKRARGQLSCTPCRVGKLKCNRHREPACDQCIKRGREAACQYVPPPTKTKPSTNVKGRIRQLESLVKELMVQQSATLADQPTPPSDGDEPQPKTNIDANVEASLGKLDIADEVTYTGETHWQTILSSLNDIQKDLAEEEEGTEVKDSSAAPDHHSAHVSFILGSTKALTRDELIAMVPEKRTVDRLLSLWFNSPDPFKIVIHAPTFQEVYKRFWKDQSVPTMWIGLLFAILGLAEAFGLRNGVPSSQATRDCIERVRRYQLLTASAAVSAEYLKPKEYTIECLLLYMAGLRNGSGAVDAWIVMGVIVRLALRMGYHRDPGHYPKITAFQAEMRRRTWGLTNMLDVLMSFSLGLPSMVRTIASDAKPPANLLDRDFNPTMTFLPPDRGRHELTPSMYIRTKLTIMNVFAQAVELSHATSPPTFEVVQALAASLEEARSSVPPALQMPDISELVTDPAEQLMYRFNIDLLYSKCRIVLYRRYMLVPITELSEQEQQKGIGEARDACIKSARRVLNHHHTIYEATKKGGQMESLGFYMESIAVHDFLLAAMVICLELSQQLEKDKMLRISNGMHCPTRQAMLKALERSHDIWTKASDEAGRNMHSDFRGDYSAGDMWQETKKARKAMAAMLARIKAQKPTPSPAKSSVFDEDGHYYFKNVGLTPASARSLRSEGIHGVLTTHDWGDIPDDFQFGTPQPTVYGASNDQSQPAGQLYALNQTSLDIDDPMNLDNLDWRAFDSEIFNVKLDDMAIQQDYNLEEQAYAQTFPTNALPYTSGMHFTVDDMRNIELSPSNLYTPFIENEGSAAWVRNPR